MSERDSSETGKLLKRIDEYVEIKATEVNQMYANAPPPKLVWPKGSQKKNLEIVVSSSMVNYYI